MLTSFGIITKLSMMNGINLISFGFSHQQLFKMGGVPVYLGMENILWVRCGA